MLEDNEIAEGMSSEELDALTLGEDVSEDTDAEEALAAVEEEDVDPKDAVIGEFRRKARDLEIENARLQGEVEARKELGLPAKEAEAPKSPLEIAEAAYVEENGDLDGFAMSGDLYRKQEAFKDAQHSVEAAKKTETVMETTAVKLQNDELSPEKAGEGLDLRSVCAMGDKYLTRGDNIDLSDTQAKHGTEAALKQAYAVMKRRILESGTDDAKTLSAALAKGKAQQPKKKPKNSEQDIDALITSDDDDGSGVDDNAPHSERLTNFIFG